MNAKAKLWFFISMLLFLSAWYFWNLGEQRRQGQPQPGPAAGTPAKPAIAPAAPAAPAPQAAAVSSLPVWPVTTVKQDPKHPYFLRNTLQPLAELTRNDRALLLRSASIDTGEGTSLPIPEHLKAKGDAGTYIVQARGNLTEAFRAALKAAGGEVVAYIPNNAYLVRISEKGAAQMLGQAQAVVPYDPYYKVERDLLRFAVGQQPVPAGMQLNVLMFPQAEQAGLAALQKLNLEVSEREPTPFGIQYSIKPGSSSVAAIAALPEVQNVEVKTERSLANDLSRLRLCVSSNTVDAIYPMGLTGNGVLVNINDTGVDTSHPDLGNATLDTPGLSADPTGHGTHVAGSIAGSGAASTGVSGKWKEPTYPNNMYCGSTNNANFRGMAPGAKLFVQDWAVSDTYLQTNAAGHGATICNNSWSYGSSTYGTPSASYDAAVRDANPWLAGDQPLTFVFSGSGMDSQTAFLGAGGGSVRSPANAKNVIAVGASEIKRAITNMAVINGKTNAHFYSVADNDQQVAQFNSTGNVDPGTEGPYGRAKPDVVAPGTWIISCRSSDYVAPTNPATITESVWYRGLTVEGNSRNHYQLFVLDTTNAQTMTVTVFPNADSTFPFPHLGVYINKDDPPTTTTPDQNTINITGPDGPYWYDIGNTNSQEVNFDLLVQIVRKNNQNNYFDYLNTNLNVPLAPSYRFESGTSMAAGMVSGLLALYQEYFQTHFGHTNSPALMKALLINGARPLGPMYDYAVNQGQNDMGWGLANATNCLAPTMTGIFDQDQTRTLQTGDSQTFEVTIPNSNANVRVTLVWTDPPGNPASNVKLVNDLDLVVTNMLTGDVFVGNSFTAGSDWSQAAYNTTNNVGTNAVVPVFDNINNVENVFLQGGANSHFKVTVVGRRVNVNAFAANTGMVGQDYALVISCDTNAPTVVPPSGTPANNPYPFVTSVTNGQVMMNYHVGAQPALSASDPPGQANQWTFFVFTNKVMRDASGKATNNAGSNVAIVTFFPTELSRPRYGTPPEGGNNADIDLYVSENWGLTNLDLSGARASNGRGGNEYVTFNNGDNKVYYIGVKSEDRQGAEFGMMAASSDSPFSETDEDGNIVVHPLPSMITIGDGTSYSPTGQMMVGICMIETNIHRVIVENKFTFENPGDIISMVSHEGDGGGTKTGQGTATLFSHAFWGNNILNIANSPPSPPQYYGIFDDSDEKALPDKFKGREGFSRRSDGPDILKTFVGMQAQGTWFFNAIDNAPGYTGQIDDVTLTIEGAPPPDETLNWRHRTIAGGGSQLDVLNIPVGVSRLTIWIATNNVNLNVYVRKGQAPTLRTYDKKFDYPANPSGVASNSITIYDSPPLSPGAWYIMVNNPSTVAGDYYIAYTWDFNFNITTYRPFPGNASALTDDIVQYSTLNVPIDQKIADLMVDVRLDHPRVADLSVHLVSPNGIRLMLSENRGGPTGVNFGSGYVKTNWLQAVASSGDDHPDTNSIVVTNGVGTLIVDYDFYTIPDEMWVVYGTNVIFDSGMINGAGTFYIDFGPGSETNLDIIMNPTYGNLGTQWTYRPRVVDGRYNYLTFTDNTNIAPLVPIKFQKPQFDPAQQSTKQWAPPGYHLGTNRLYVMPEETMKPLIGSSAQGNWTLEVWDNLSGNVGTNAKILSWQLEVALVATNNPVTVLTNLLNYTNSLPTNGVAYFAVDVPYNVRAATNILISSSGMSLTFNQNGLPGQTPGDYTLLAAGAGTRSATLVTNAGTPPALMPGQRYYLAVRAPNGGDFSLEVDFDMGIIPLSVNSTTPGTVESYQWTYYKVALPNNMKDVQFSLTALSGDADLFVSKGPYLPTAIDYDYASWNYGTTPELILVSNSPPGGMWYIGVFNPTLTQVSYTLQVIDTVTNGSSGAPNLVYAGKPLGFKSNPVYTKGKALSLSVDTVPGIPYRIQTSTNLIHWQDWTNFYAPGENTILFDPALPEDKKFYRVVPR